MKCSGLTLYDAVRGWESCISGSSRPEGLAHLHPFGCVVEAGRVHVLYMDDSGSVTNADDRFFVLGGLSVFERGIYHLINATDRCVAGFGLGEPDDIELHGSEMYNGKSGIWKSINKRADREELIKRALGLLTDNQPSFRLFAVAVDKQAVSPRDPVEVAFEEMCNRFNLFLQRSHNRTQDNQRGLLVMDESKHEKPLQALTRNFRVNGGRWGHFRHLAEVPLFVDSKASRLIQLADMVAWATRRKYEIQDGRFFDPLIPRFDADGGVIHGLYHVKGSAGALCYCPACHSRDQRDRRDKFPQM